MNLTGLPHDAALRALNIYAYLDLKSSDGYGLVSQNNICRLSGLSKNTVRETMRILLDAGFIEYIAKEGSGTKFRVVPIDWPTGRQLFEYLSSGSTNDQLSGSDADPLGKNERISSRSIKGSAGDPLKDQPVTPYEKENKNTNKNSSSSYSSVVREHQDQLIKIWNEHKPDQWEAIKILGNRAKTAEHLAKQLGGWAKLLEYLPLALAEFKRDKFWGSKRMTWANVMGSGKTDKTHFAEMLDRALAEPCQGPKANSNLEHPDFLPPSLAGTLYPKHNNFGSAEAKAAAMEDARKFYAQQDAK